MTVETEVQPVEEQSSSEDTSRSVQAAYDRIANPGKVEPQAADVAIPATEQSASEAHVELTSEQYQEMLAGLSKIPKLEKQLNDAGGRYGALKQSLEQVQQRIADKHESSGAAPDVDEILAEIKQHFGEDELYTGLKAAFSKLANVRGGVDPDAVSQIVAQQIQQAKQAESEAAITQLTERHPTWMEDRETPDFNEWRESLSAKDRDRFNRSKDPDYVADKLDEFNEWKAKKAAKPEPEEQKPEPKPEKPVVSKRLANAVLPTTGTKPKIPVDDRKAQIQAAYERVAGNRR